jgi:hypothetical protein
MVERRQVGMFDVEERLAGLSKKGDDRERLAAVGDFGRFRRPTAPRSIGPRHGSLKLRRRLFFHPITSVANGPEAKRRRKARVSPQIQRGKGVRGSRGKLR